MNEELKKIIYEAVKKAYPEVDINIEDIELEHPANPKFGDLSTNIAMKIGKKQGRAPSGTRQGENPYKIAENLVKRIQEEIDSRLRGNDKKERGNDPRTISTRLRKTTDGQECGASKIGIEKVEAVKPGFINFYLSDRYYQRELGEILSKGKKYADLDIGGKQKVQVEFISANPTGPLTLANGRGGFSGDVLANVFKKSGYNVEREYYVNNGGNQVLTLGKAILYLHEEDSPEEDLVLYSGKYIDEWHDEHVSELKLVEDPFKIGKTVAKDFLKQLIKPAVKRMGINFDTWFSEDGMIKKGEVDEAIKSLKKLTYEKDGALWLKTTEFGDDKDRVLVKQDGEKTYFANDIAYHWDKFAKRKFDKVVDLWGADHHGYVARMQAATEALGFGGKLDIVIFQMVRLIKNGKEYKMSKRKGTYVAMDELLELIGTKDAADVARFFFVSRDFDTHMDFDLDLAKDTSEKNPVYYVKYASARINGILRNTKADFSKPDLNMIKEPSEIDLIKKLSELPEVIEQVINDKKYPVHKFTYYITEVAERFHKFYHECKVISDDRELTKARLALVAATKKVLEITGEDILGLEMPERM